MNQKTFHAGAASLIPIAHQSASDAVGLVTWPASAAVISACATTTAKSNAWGVQTVFIMTMMRISMMTRTPNARTERQPPGEAAACNKNSPKTKDAGTPPSVAGGFTLLKPSDCFCVGDIVADCAGQWRGPIPHDSDMVGREIRSYMCASEGLPPVRAAARQRELCRMALETQSRDSLERLACELKAECNRYLNGICETLACLQRGGYTQGQTPDCDAATCERHEQVKALETLLATTKVCYELADDIRLPGRRKAKE